jgi:GNAT superfamily N-acetyltransferase
LLEIYELSQRMDLYEDAVQVFWRNWGSQNNFNFYHDCIMHSCGSHNDLPKFYIAVQNNAIAATYALLRNDLISRQDLFPWLACLYIVPELRGNKFGSLLLQHAMKETAKSGFENLYLCTDLDGYYEKYNWSFLTNGYIFNGDLTKIYVQPTKQ